MYMEIMNEVDYFKVFGMCLPLIEDRICHSTVIYLNNDLSDRAFSLFRIKT